MSNKTRPTQEALKLSYKSLDAKSEALDKFQDSLSDRRLVTGGSHLSYPFNCNQAEWESMIFSRAWNAALAWAVDEGLIEVSREPDPGPGHTLYQ